MLQNDSIKMQFLKDLDLLTDQIYLAITAEDLDLTETLLIQRTTLLVQLDNITQQNPEIITATNNMLANNQRCIELLKQQKLLAAQNLQQTRLSVRATNAYNSF